MNNSLNVFIPVYNEIGSADKIEANVRRILKVFSDANFYFYDNASMDGTAYFLLELRNKYPDRITLVSNSENIGFQKNLAKIAELPTDRMILILGANDQVYTPGLRKLQDMISKGGFDLIVCNTCYVTGGARTRLMANEEEKVKIPFATTSIDEYFSKHGVIPNGIMQYVIHPRHCNLFGKYDFWMSPQVAVFFDVFPGKVCYLPPPPVALVNRIENSGWRSSKEGIIETHMILARDIVSKSCELLVNRRISLRTFIHIRFFYTHAVMCLVYKSVFVRDYWGGWSLPFGGRVKFLAKICKELFQLRPLLWVNSIFVAAVLVKFILYKIQSICKYFMEQAHGQKHSFGR